MATRYVITRFILAITTLAGVGGLCREACVAEEVNWSFYQILHGQAMAVRPVLPSRHRPSGPALHTDRHTLQRFGIGLKVCQGLGGDTSLIAVHCLLRL